jgi:hypothetical protein
VVEKVRKRLSVSKGASPKFETETLISKTKTMWKLKDGISLKALSYLDDNVDIKRDWENIRKNIKISATDIIVYYKLKQQKHCLHEECSYLFD